MTKTPTQRIKGGKKHQRWQLKDARKHAELNAQIQRIERVSKTHIGEITAAGKEIARWLIQRLGTNAPAPTTHDIMTRIHAKYQHPKFSTEDQIVIGRTALVVLKSRDSAAWDKYRLQCPDVMDRPVPEGLEG